MDKILIKGLRIFAYHGVNPEEKRDGQNFVLDITCLVNTSEACDSDSIDSTISYSAVIKEVTAVFTSEKFDLIETAADTVAREILKRFTGVQSVTVLLKKPEAPMRAEFDYVAVEVTRDRGDLQ